MPESAHYNQAPILEAILEIRLVPSDELTLENIEALYPRFIEDYPEKRVTYSGSPDHRRDEKTESRPNGYRFISADKHKIVQMRCDGFAMSWLPPYDRWEALRDEAKKLWEIYRASCTDTTIRHCGLRYVNRIDLPTESFDPGDYLNIGIFLAQTMPEKVETYFLTMTLPYPQFSAVAQIRQGLVLPALEGKTSIALDINLYRQENLPQDETELWSLFEILRTGKNQIFEACITDETRKLIA